MRSHRRLALVVALCSAVATAGYAGVPEATPKLPVLGAETVTGTIVSSTAANVAPTPKVVDGDASDWTGTSTRLGGTAIHPHGEYVHQDYLGDAWGADDGFDAERKATLNALKDLEPRTYRVDALQQAAGAQFGADRPVGADMNFGDTTAPNGVREQADIEEVRVAADDTDVFVMVRTLAMAATPATAVLVLFDTEPGGDFTLPRHLGGIRTAAEDGFILTDGRIRRISHGGELFVTPCVPSPDPCPVDAQAAFNPAGFDNVVEARFRRDLVAPNGVIRMTVATGIDDGNGLIAARAAGDAASDLVNVAFRSEPARIWMDERQAFALRDGTVEPFFVTVDANRLAAGATETFIQTPGYFEAVYLDADSPVNREETINAYFQGPWQHYGVYLPATYRPGNVHPAMFWMHYRGGHAHDAAAWEPGILRDFGDGGDAIVITPSARGESSWYTGRGMVDFLDAWDDAHARWSLDEDRTYLGGHSMGGWASWLLGLLFPDRWAAANPQDGLLVPGLWTGVGAPTGAQNGADINAQFLYPLLENARNLPYAILHGTADELVPVTGAIAAGQRLQDLGFRYRTYLYHAYEHYSAPIWDDWREMQSYLWSHRRDRNPSRVTYKVSPALNHAVSTISAPAGVDLGFNFNRAYWVSGLTVRTPGRDPSNIGTIDAITRGRGVTENLALPELGAGLWGPYTMHGQRWLANGTSVAQNIFAATATNLSAVTFDLARMSLSTTLPVGIKFATDGPTTVTLRGTWTSAPSVLGATVTGFDAQSLTLTVAGAGEHSITVTP